MGEFIQDENEPQQSYPNRILADKQTLANLIQDPTSRLGIAIDALNRAGFHLDTRADNTTPAVVGLKPIDVADVILEGRTGNLRATLEHTIEEGPIVSSALRLRDSEGRSAYFIYTDLATDRVDKAANSNIFFIVANPMQTLALETIQLDEQLPLYSIAQIWGMTVVANMPIRTMVTGRSISQYKGYQGQTLITSEPMIRIATAPFEFFGFKKIQSIYTGNAAEIDAKIIEATAAIVDKIKNPKSTQRR